MKKSELKQLIKEEIKSILKEDKNTPEVKIGDRVRITTPRTAGSHIYDIVVTSIKGKRIKGNILSSGGTVVGEYVKHLNDKKLKENLSESQQVQIQKEMDDLVKKGKERLVKVQELMRKKGYEI